MRKADVRYDRHHLLSLFYHLSLPPGGQRNMKLNPLSTTSYSACSSKCQSEAHSFKNEKERQSDTICTTLTAFPTDATNAPQSPAGPQPADGQRQRLLVFPQQQQPGRVIPRGGDPRLSPGVGSSGQLRPHPALTLPLRSHALGRPSSHGGPRTPLMLKAACT